METAPRRRSWADLPVVGGYLGLSVWIYSALWAAPRDVLLAATVSDHEQHEWFLAWGAHVLRHGGNPFVTDAVNAPDGVNLLANTSLLGLGVPLAPLTWSAGPDVTYAVALTLGLAGTATGWYLLLRRVAPFRPGAALGGALAAFGPPMLSHAGGHLNLIAQFLVPWLVWWTVRLGEPGRALRHGAVLGLLVAWQFLIGAEVLTYTALATGLFVGTWAALRPRAARARLGAFARGLGVTALVAGSLLAAPIAVQFWGPHAYRGLDGAVVGFANDLAALVRTRMPDAAWYENYALNPNEQNAHFGWGLVLLAPVLLVWLRRSAVVLAAGVVGVVFAALSLGREVVVGWRETGVPGPWALLGELPVLDHLPPSRLTMVCLPVFGLLVAAGVDRLRTSGTPARVLLPVALAVALVPLVPERKAVVDREPVPEFFASGEWRDHLAPGDTVVAVPVPGPGELAAYRWQTAVDFEIVLAGGYFLAPGVDGVGTWGAAPRPTGELLAGADAGQLPEITGADRRQARADLAYWDADVVVLPMSRPRAEQTAEVITALLGVGGRRVADVQLWDVRTPGGGN
ncbi:hypothetical protein ACI797_27155 [Geodermatophilus sp. SYSU D00691]